MSLLTDEFDFVTVAVFREGRTGGIGRSILSGNPFYQCVPVVLGVRDGYREVLLRVPVRVRSPAVIVDEFQGQRHV